MMTILLLLLTSCVGVFLLCTFIIRKATIDRANCSGCEASTFENKIERFKEVRKYSVYCAGTILTIALLVSFF